MKKIVLALALVAFISVGRIAGVGAVATPQDFTNDVAAGIQQQRTTYGAKTIRSEITNGESRNAGDENNKNIAEQDVEKEVETEIDGQKSKDSTDSSTTKTDSTDSSSTDASSSTDSSKSGD
jgi:hypothetical protein